MFTHICPTYDPWTYLHSSRSTGVLLSCSVISCCVLTTKSAEPGWPGPGAAGTTPNCWYKHYSNTQGRRSEHHRPHIKRVQLVCECVCVYLPGSNALISRTQPPHCPDHCLRSKVPHPSSGPCVYGERGQLQKETTVHIMLIRRNPSANPFTLQDEKDAASYSVFFLMTTPNCEATDIVNMISTLGNP